MLFAPDNVSVLGFDLDGGVHRVALQGASRGEVADEVRLRGGLLSAGVRDDGLLAFSDGQRLAVAVIAGQAWIYTQRDGRWEPTEVLRAGLVNLQDVTWSPDGSVLLGGVLAGRTRLWLTDVEEAVHLVCSAVGQHITEDEWEGLLPGIDYAPPCADGVAEQPEA